MPRATAEQCPSARGSTSILGVSAWSTTSFLQVPTLCSDASQNLLPGLTQTKPAWSSPEPGSSPTPQIPLTKAIIETNFPFQKVLRETFPSQGWADSNPGPGCPYGCHKTHPSSQRSPPQRKAKRPQPRLSMPRVSAVQGSAGSILHCTLRRARHMERLLHHGAEGEQGLGVSGCWGPTLHPGTPSPAAGAHCIPLQGQESRQVKEQEECQEAESWQKTGLGRANS